MDDAMTDDRRQAILLQLERARRNLAVQSELAEQHPQWTTPRLMAQRHARDVRSCVRSLAELEAEGELTG